jgi:polyketide biosynthesis enoyl-CoA hydratase PksI
MSNVVTVTCVEDGIFRLNMNDPQTENRLSERLISEFIVALKDLALEPTLKVLLITGRKDVFCAGATREVLNKITNGTTDVKDLLLPNHMLSFPVPIIAAVEGHAVGGGLVLALYCDMVVAAERSRYGFNFTHMGFTPGMGTTSLLPALVGYSFASEMLLTAKFYKGRELRERGLFNYVVSAEEVLNVALELAQRMAEKPRHVLELVKDTLALPRRHALQEALSREHLMHKVCFSRPDTALRIEETYLS